MCNRQSLDLAASYLSSYRFPHRLLWLTDTFADKNGVSHALQDVLKEVQRRNLPIDILVSSNKIESQDHLIVVPSYGEFHLFDFEQQRFNIPNLEELGRLVYERGYDRIMVSTESPMGQIALLLGQSFNFPSYFFIHTDWSDFFSLNSDMSDLNLLRTRTFLNQFYRQFSGVVCLNEDHRQWLVSPAVGLESARVFKTAHWPSPAFKKVTVQKSEVLSGIEQDQPVLIYVGRLSAEKGVRELPEFYRELRGKIPRLQLVLAGEGPEESALRHALPEAHFLGWVDSQQLIRLYNAADLLVLLSRNDSFPLVLGEAFACGLPVAVYSSNGAKELVVNGVNGIMADTPAELLGDMIHYFQHPDQLQRLRDGAIKSVERFRAEAIMDRLMSDLGLTQDTELMSFRSAKLKLSGSF